MFYSRTPTELLKSVTISNILEFGELLKQGFQMVETSKIGYTDDEVSNLHAVQGLHICTYTDDEVSIEENCISLVSFPRVNFLPSNLRSLRIKNSRAFKSLPRK